MRLTMPLKAAVAQGREARFWLRVARSESRTQIMGRSGACANAAEEPAKSPERRKSEKRSGEKTASPDISHSARERSHTVFEIFFCVRGPQGCPG